MTNGTSVPDELQETDVSWSTPDGIPIVARYWPVEAPRGTVVLVHGIGDHSGRFGHVAQWLNERSYAVFAADLRGNGRSGGQRGYVSHFQVLIDDLLDTIDRVPGRSDQPTLLYGQSMGGLLCLATVMRRQVDLAGVIATSPALRIAMATPAWKVCLGKCIGGLLPKFSLPTGLDVTQLTDDRSVVERLIRDPLRHQRITARLFFGIRDMGHWCRKHARELSVATLLLHGDDDRITACSGSREFADSAPDRLVTFRVIPGGMHELHNQLDSTEFFQTIDDWLEQLRVKT